MTGIVLLPNVYLATERATYNPTTDSTGGYTAHLAGVMAHIEITRASAYTLLPDAALTSDYTATVASGTDIAVGDRISALALLDGVTPWPGEWPSGSANEYFVVTLVRETAPLFLPQRAVYLKRMTGGGPAHT